MLLALAKPYRTWRDLTGPSWLGSALSGERDSLDTVLSLGEYLPGPGSTRGSNNKHSVISTKQ